VAPTAAITNIVEPSTPRGDTPLSFEMVVALTGEPAVLQPSANSVLRARELLCYLIIKGDLRSRTACPLWASKPLPFRLTAQLKHLVRPDMIESVQKQSMVVQLWTSRKDYFTIENANERDVR
jgi:hypothetical protein